jgi:hypothetical protein
MNKPNEPMSISGTEISNIQKKKTYIDGTALALAKSEGRQYVRPMRHTSTLHAFHKSAVEERLTGLAAKDSADPPITK